jgi:TRAP-type mannitol/chloroaromatic compound transport system permease large subunit
VSDPSLGLAMLGLIVVAIMMGYPTAFTLMGLGAVFGFVAFWDPNHHWWLNRVFDLIAQRTYGVMVNDTLLSVPLFVFMGYIMERAALVDRMFHAVQLAFRRVPASLAITTLLVCAFWGIASGIVGAVVVLMGVIALRPMLKAGYNVKLASGAITAGGTLGILIPPSVMLIVYAAVAGQSIVKLYAAAMLPGFFLTFLYLAYILGWALIDPKIAPKLPPDAYRLPVPDYLRRLDAGGRQSVVPGLLAAAFRPRWLGVPYRSVLTNVLAVLVPVVLTTGTFGLTWWYVVVYNAAPVTAAVPPSPGLASAPVAAPAVATPAAGDKPQERGTPAVATPTSADKPQELGTAAADAEAPQELGAAGDAVTPSAPGRPEGPPEEMGTLGIPTATTAGHVPDHFYTWFWTAVAVAGLLLALFFWRMDGEQLEVLKELIVSVVPLGVLTVVVLAVILFGICTATESAAIGALGALYLAVMARFPKAVAWWSLAGVALGLVLSWWQRESPMSMLVAASIGGTFVGTVVPGLLQLRRSKELRENLKQSTFLTAKTTAMVCWLFVGSALFSAVFALHGGQALIERWVLSMNLSPIGFMIIAQVIIFLLGWPLEWTEIIVIFCPIFIPLLSHFNIDPLLFGTMVAVNLQAAFLSPPVAMSAFYLKGVAPKHVSLNQIFAGMMPYMLIVIVCLIFMYIWPGMTLWLPEFLYGN